MGIFLRKRIKLLLVYLSNFTFFIFKDKMTASDHSFLSVNIRGNPMCHDIFHFGVHFLMIQFSFSGSIYNSLRHGMRKMFFQTGSNAESFRFRIITKYNNLLYRWFCLCQCSGLIKYNRVCFSHCFQIFSAFHGNPKLSRLSDGGKNSKRHGQFQCTRKIHHKN